MVATLIDMAGQTFNYLKVIERAPRPEHLSEHGVYWKVVCICGKEFVTLGRPVRVGHIKSCGCKRSFLVGKSKRKHEPWLASAKAVYRHRYSDGTLTEEEFLKLSQQPCHYCGAILTNKHNCFTDQSCLPETKIAGDFYHNGVDRIDSSKPHDSDNCVPCCKFCNYAKKDRSYDDFLEWIKQAYHHISNVENGVSDHAGRPRS